MAIPADNPISSEDEDLLGRAPVSRVLADEIRSLDASAGCVVGILGPWGSGKTSLVTLIREQLSRKPSLTVLEFNPWLFSGADQLLESFFLEIGAQFRGRRDQLGDLASDLEAYGEVVAPLKWLPIIGIWVERARSVAKGLKKARERRRGGALAQRRRLESKLVELTAPIVIVVDDIDRLRTDEIREIFKLVRLTANFPNVIYLLAFDRQRVEIALSEEGLVGRDYLEKILQVAYDIPVMPEALVTTLLGDALEKGLQDIDNTGPFSSTAWPDILYEVIRPLIRNMRDIRRYVAAVHGTVRGLEGRIELADVLALEAIRVFLPDVFSALVNAQEGLTTTTSLGTHHQDPPRLKASIEAMVKAGGEQADVVRAFITRLFHAGRRHIENNHFGPEWEKQWLRERRVAHIDVLRYYLERLEGEQLLAFSRAEQAFAHLADGVALEAFLDELDGSSLADAIAALEVYEGEYPVEAIEPAGTVLLNQIHRLPERRRGLFAVRPDLIVNRVVLRMLRQLKTPEEVEATVRKILPKVRQCSDKFDLLKLVGYREGAGHKLIPEAASNELEAELRSQVRNASGSELADERDLLLLLYWTKKDAAELSEEPITIPREPRFDAALLKRSVAETWSQPLDSRAGSSKKQLHWDALVEVVGGEAVVREIVDTTSKAVADDPALKEARELAERYLGGWRPKDFGDDGE